MKRYLTALLAAAVAGALFVASPLVAAPKGTSYNQSTDHVTQCAGGTINIFAPDKMWPPNHKYVEDLFVAATDANGDRVDLTTTGTHDQYVEGDNGLEEQNGAGNTGDDITSDDAEATVVKSNDENSGFPNVIATEGDDNGSVVTDWKARAERSGRDQTGRVYTLTADAAFSDGSPCSAELSITVPHDMRPSNR